MTKTCSRCKVTKPASEFNAHKRMASGLHSYCRQCSAEHGREWRASRPPEWHERQRAKRRAAYDSAKQHARAIKRNFGLTREEYDAMLRAQDGRCAVCLGVGARRLAVDHCHKTNRVRGLLCFKCNSALGKLNDDPARIRRLAEYAERWQS